jgi:hypothetical protein
MVIWRLLVIFWFTYCSTFWSWRAHNIFHLDDTCVSYYGPYSFWCAFGDVYRHKMLVMDPCLSSFIGSPFFVSLLKGQCNALPSPSLPLWSLHRHNKWNSLFDISELHLIWFYTPAGLDLGPSLREICAANRSDEKQVSQSYIQPDKKKHYICFRKLDCKSNLIECIAIWFVKHCCSK